MKFNAAHNKKIILRSLIVPCSKLKCSVLMKPSLGPHLTLFRPDFNEFHALPAKWTTPFSSAQTEKIHVHVHITCLRNTRTLLNGWLFSCWNQFCLLCWHGHWNKASASISTHIMHIVKALNSVAKLTHSENQFQLALSVYSCGQSQPGKHGWIKARLYWTKIAKSIQLLNWLTKNKNYADT